MIYVYKYKEIWCKEISPHPNDSHNTKYTKKNETMLYIYIGEVSGVNNIQILLYTKMKWPFTNTEIKKWDDIIYTQIKW